MTRRTFLSGFAVGLAISRAQAAEQKITLTGSSTVAPLVAEIAKRFEQHTGARVDVQTGGSSRGIADVRKGLADIGMVSRALKDSEQDLTAYSLALDGISLIVHRSNPIASLTDEHIRAIYTGQVRNWQALGGPNRPITVVNKADGRSTLELFLHYTGLNSRDIRAQVIIGDNQQGIKTVAGNPGAVGYVSIGAAEYEHAQGSAIRLLPMKGVAASVAHVRAGTFPLARPLNLVVRGNPSAWVARFLAFAQSAQVNDLIEAQFFVPVARP